MRVSRSQSTAGSIYRIYRSTDDFVTQMQSLVPFLRADRYDILIGGTSGEPHVALTIGPLDAETDAEFRSRIAQFLDK